MTIQLFDYTLKRDGQTLPVDLADYVFIISARVMFRGSQRAEQTSDPTYSTATLSGTYSALLPLVPSGYDFYSHTVTGKATFANDDKYDTANVKLGIDTPWGTFETSAVLQPGETRTLSITKTSSSDYCGQPAEVWALGGASVSGYNVTNKTKGVKYGTIVYKQTYSPSVSINGNSASFSGYLNDSVESDWISLNGLTPLEANNLAISVGGSEEVYIKVEVTATPKLAAPALHTGERTTEQRPCLEMTLTAEPDNPAQKYHARVRLSGYATMSPLILELESVNGGWEYWDGSWQPFPAGGVDPGTKVRVQAPELGYQTYYWDAASYDGTAYGHNATSRPLRILVTVTNLFSVVHNDQELTRIYSLTVTEASNGEIGEINFMVRNRNAESAKLLNYGDTVLVAVNDDLGNTEEFRGMIRQKIPAGAELLSVSAFTGDGIFGERIVKEDYPAQDIGLTVKAIIETYCQPLTAVSVDTATGFVAPVAAKDKTAIRVLEQLRSDFGVHYHVDKDWDAHLYLPGEIGAAVVTIQRGEI